MKQQFLFLIKRCNLFIAFVSFTKDLYKNNHLYRYISNEIIQTKETLKRDFFGKLSLCEFGIPQEWKYSEILQDKKKWCFILFIRFILDIDDKKLMKYTPSTKILLIKKAYNILFYGKNND